MSDELKLDTYEPDACCAKRLVADLLPGKLVDASEWTCPDCGTIWRPDPVGPVRHWTPRPVILVWKGR